MKRTTIEFMIGWLDALRRDDVAALNIVTIEDVALPDGIYNVFTLDAGTITRIDDYTDRHDALAAAGLSNATTTG